MEGRAGPAYTAHQHRKGNDMKKKIESGTIIRTVLLALALVNQLLTASGHSVIGVSDDDVTQLISAAFTIVTALIAWWENNSFTQDAIEADEYLKAVKMNNEGGAR